MTVDSLCLLLAICAQASRTKDGRKTKGDLMKETGFSNSVVSTGYAFNRSLDTKRQIGLAFAKLYGFEPARLLRLIDESERAELLRLIDEEKDKEQRAVLKARLRTMQAEDDALRAQLEMELRKFRCTQKGPHLESAAGLEAGWFDQLVDAELIIPAIRCCKACALRAKSRVGDAWGALLKQNADKLPAAINRAVAALEVKGRSIGYKGLAAESKMPYADVRRTLAQAGFEKPREGRKNFGRYLPIWLVLCGYLFGGKSADAAVAALLRPADPQVYLIGGIRAWLLEQFRRWAQADRLRQWLAGCSGASLALGSAS